MRSAIAEIRLRDFRSYESARLAPGGASVFLFGANGAGKTNLLEAISFFSPGRGLRGSALVEIGRRAPGEAQGRPWAVSADIDTPEGQVRAGTGVELEGASRRVVRIEAEPATPAAMADFIRPMWLTPAQDRLFLEAPAERRRFLDRLVLAAEPGHGAIAAAYERGLRERARLLAEDADPAWISAVETRMAGAGARLAQARARTVAALQAEIDTRVGRPFPLAQLELSGDWERAAVAGAATEAIESDLAAALARGRSRDAAAGRTLTGPHRGDLLVVDAGKGRAAAECSTGEQKALVLNLVLAQAARLSRAESAPNPILLLDEVAAHLDSVRRAALFDEIEALGLQAFLTGTDEALFETLKGRAIGVHIDASRLRLLEP
ncbi:MAG: DNA replication/repair protein RecF [Caulobacteraceae bacterium]|nr:DNA replication/repair protein RecF [Caulobacteraceae bacterium]